MASIPATTGTPERSFSTLERIFTDYRASMDTERVSNLALISHYADEVCSIDLDEIIDLFAKIKPRRIP